MNWYVTLIREVLASIRSQPVVSLLTGMTVAGLCLAALLTTGRTVAAERAVLDQLDSAGTRTLIVRADIDAGVTSGILDRLVAIEAVEAVVGFGPVVDARNVAIVGGPKVPMRRAYGTIGDRLLTATLVPGGDRQLAIGSAAGVRAAGMIEGIGGLTTDDGLGTAVTNGLEVPAHLQFLEPLVVIPSSTDDALAGADHDAPLAVLVVLVREPPQVEAVEEVLRSLLSPPQGTTVTIETSSQLAAIRAAISGELGTFGRSTVLGIVAISAFLVAVNLLGLVAMRRKDFGRRRALGATRWLIVQLLVLQVTVLAATGALAGTGAAVLWLSASGSPLPGRSFIFAVGIVGVLTAVVASLPPAMVAARRDPLHELRVP